MRTGGFSGRPEVAFTAGLQAVGHGLAVDDGGKRMESDIPKAIGRPPRNGRDHDPVREAIVEGCSLYETVRRTGVSMSMFYRLKRELRQSGLLVENDTEQGVP